jgi:hypothetical protein
MSCSIVIHMIQRDYKMNRIIKFLKEGKDQEAYELLKIETQKVVSDFKIHKISEKEICDLYNPLYKQVSLLDKERKAPPWVWDLLIETVDMHVTGYPFDIVSIENIVSN